MSVNTGHGEGATPADVVRDGPQPEAVEKEGEWKTVPTGDGTVSVRWSDLVAMRDRIQRLEREVADLEGDVEGLQNEVEQLEGELAATQRRHQEAIERYEALLSDPDGPSEREGDAGPLTRLREWLGF